ncbi:MAG: VOC family protein, partial [Hyphomicrobiaceae bacterium]
MPSAAPTGKTVVAGMCYHDPLAAADWLCKAFGFERHRVVTDKKGKITHVEVKFGNGLVMIGPAERSEVSRFFVHPEEIGGAETQSCYVVVDDADAHFVRAKAAGATIVADVGDEEYGGRGYMCRDPEGHLWNFGTYDPWPAQPAALDRSKEQKSAWQIDLKRPAVAAGLAAVLLVVLGTAAWALHNRHVLKRELTNAIPERIAAERETNAIRQVLANERAAKLKTEKLLAAEQRAREKTEQAEAHWRQELQKARDTSVDPASGTGTMTDLHGQLGRERAQVKDLSAKNEALTRAVEQERTAKLTTMAALQKTAADTQRQLEATQAAQKAVEQERAAAQKAAEQAAETQRQLEAARKSADQE